MGKARILAILSVAFASLLFPAEQVGANPYMAGYEAGSQVVQTHEVLVDVNFGFTDPGLLPSGVMLAGVTSVAGAIGDQPSGNVYQNGVSLTSSYVVTWNPQVWHGGTLVHIDTFSLPAWNWADLYLRTDLFDGGVYFRIWGYRTWESHLNDAPTYIGEKYWATTDTNLLVGKTYHIIQNNGYWFRHFQFGTESNAAINGTDWELMNGMVSYYDGVSSWRYSPGYVTHGDSSLITWTGEDPWAIGGEVYPGVNTEFTMDHEVIWKHTGSIIPDGSPLWSGTGTIVDLVAKPYVVAYGGVTGVVTDHSPPYAALSNAAVKAYQGGVLKGSDVTDSSGRYEINGLVPGIYLVTASHTGYYDLTTPVMVSQHAYATLDFQLTHSSGGGGCPFLQVWDGGGYLEEGLLDIHNAEGVDVTYEHMLMTMPALLNGRYAFRLTEHPVTISDIDQVQLRAILEDGTIEELPLKMAWHSEDGNVRNLLLKSDDRRAEEKGADHNGGVSQSIDLEFAALGPQAEAVGFIFTIEGYNMVCKTCG